MLSLGHNLASDASCALGAAGDLQNTNPLLGPLAANGGPTQTHGLQVGSPAIDAANATGAPATDQRGVARPVGTGFDIGAFEGTVDGGPTPTLSIDSVTADEGNGGTTAFTFTVTLSAASAATVTVDFATADGTATAGSDYTAVNGTLTFAPGVVTQPVAVSVLGDTAVEAAETFFVDLSNPTNATIAARRASGRSPTTMRMEVGTDPNPLGVGAALPGAATRRSWRHPDPRAAPALGDRPARGADRPPPRCRPVAEPFFRPLARELSGQEHIPSRPRRNDGRFPHSTARQRPAHPVHPLRRASGFLGRSHVS